MRKKIGSRLLAAAFSCALISFAAGLFSLASGQDHTESSYATVAGTVFRDPGFALPDATVTLMLRGGSKRTKIQAVTTARGEFSFRVPAAPATYVVRASLKGFQSDEKEASISGGERVEVTLTLTRESK